MYKMMTFNPDTNSEPADMKTDADKHEGSTDETT